jgi:hypothetical protein
MICVIIESPYAGEVAENAHYLWDCLRDSFKRGEAPFASHGIYPSVLNDHDPEERKMGLLAGYAWWPAAERIIFYTDRGWSEGMKAALARAVAIGKPFETRSIR